MPDSQISWRDLLTFLSVEGQRQVLEFVRRAQQERGSNWLPEIRNEFPMFAWIVELVATRTADEAFDELQAAYPHYPLHFVRDRIVHLHGMLKNEIYKARFQ